MFIRLHLKHVDIVYDKLNNEAFINKFEKAQYNAALAITDAIRGTSRKKFYAKLVLESLKLSIGLENCLVFTKFSLQDYLNNYFN